MLLATDLDQLEQERAHMWELYALLLDFAPDFKFTAKELAKHTEFTKSELGKLLFRLSVNKALLLTGKTTSGASIYSLNPEFIH